jgi:ACS family hexuronate transporter-like MFS transporter
MSPPITRRQRWSLALAATFTMTISYLDRQTLAVLAPRVTAELGIDEVRFGLLLSAFSVAYLVGAPLAGLWIGRVGPRRGLLLAVLAWTAVAGLHTVVPGFAALFALRIALGLAESPSFPGAAQTVERALLPEDRARGLGVLFTGSSLGAMIAPLLATALMAAFSWRAAFLGTALAGLVWVPVWLAVTGTPQGRALLDPPAAPHRAPPDETPAAGGYRDGGRAATIAPLARNPALWRALVLVIASAPAISFVSLWSSKLLVRTFGLSPLAVGRYLWITPLCYDLGSVFFGDRSSRRAQRRGFDGSPDRALVGLAAALCAALAAMPLAASPTAAMAWAAVSSFGGAGLYALLTSDLFGRVHTSQVATAGGLCAMAQSVAIIVAMPLVGASVQAHGDYTRPAIALGLWTLPGAALWLAWRPPPTATAAAG